MYATTAAEFTALGVAQPFSTDLSLGIDPIQLPFDNELQVSAGVSHEVYRLMDVRTAAIGSFHTMCNAALSVSIGSWQNAVMRCA